MKINQFMPYIGNEEYEAMKVCFEDNWITEGPKCKEFSERFLKLTSARYGVFAQNGTLALYLGLRAAGVKPGDEVIVPNFTFIASANAVEMCGAKPVFVDINLEDLQIDITDCDRVLSKKTTAIMPVHLFGMAADMGEVMSYAVEKNLKVIEDAAQAVGVTWGGKHCGTFGDVGCFSFFADKTITMGEGGFVTTNSEEIYKKLLYLRNQGRLNRGSFVHPEIGYNFRITDFQAAMGLVQLDKLKEIKDKKRNLLKLYKDRLSEVEDVSIVEPCPRDESIHISNHIPFRVVIMCQKPVEGLMKRFEEKEIEVRSVFYPLHKQPCYNTPAQKLYKNINNQPGYVVDSHFPDSLHAYNHAACLPSYPTLEEEKVDYICDTIKEYYA
jgi:perosamine synthetase